MAFNTFMHNVEKWANIPQNLHLKIFKACLAIFQHYAQKS